MDTTNPNWFLKARLKTRQLLLLIALDDYRNIHRAADELHMTQPAASKQIKDLEEMLDVKLFERLPRGMEPTIYGETMIRHARMALTSLALAHDDIVTLKAGLTGQVEVGVIMEKNTNLGTIHHAIIDFNGKSYIIYHNAKLPTGGEYRRSVAIEELHYGPDGKILPVPQTAQGPAANPSAACKR
jgi:hypothetical protein